MLQRPSAGNKKSTKPKLKVSQATIDKIKADGMTKSLKKAATTKNAEYLEGVKRMYGARRVSAARGAASDSRIQKPSFRQPKKPGFGNRPFGGK